MSKRIYNLKNKKDNFWRWTSFIFCSLLILIFIAIFIFIVISAIPGIKAFGIDSIVGSTEFNLALGKAGVWSPIAITLLVAFGAILIAAPVGVKTATFIKFRINKKYQRTASIIVQALSGIPSVIFGIFALNALGKVVGLIFGINGAYNIINAIIMLSFMILPTIISLTLNAYENVETELITNPISLGLTRTYSIYKIYKKKATNGIVVAIIIAIGRALGETMALSMILTSESYTILGQGILETLTSSLGTLGSVIATNMFSETGGDEIRGVLYCFGIILFLLVMILNGVILYFTRKRTKSSKTLKLQNIIASFIMWIPRTISSGISQLFIGTKIKANESNINEYIVQRNKKHKLKNIHTWWWVFFEILCTLITFAFLIWICLDIIINGLSVMLKPYNSSPDFTGYNSTAFSYGLDTTGQALINTIIIIFVSLAISIPIALIIAIYLSEYAKNKKVKKTILFFVDCLGSNPSIIFGMFGLAVFIELFGLSINGSLGRSLLAGSLTISIVILPSLIRTLQQSLEMVPDRVRINAISLGCTKWETTWKVVIKHALKSMVSAVVLAIGRIMAETAPLYLTAGLTSVSGIGLLLPGQTLTTRIYAQLNGERTLQASVAIQYECAFIALAIVILLIWIGFYVIPNSKHIKNNIINFIASIKNIFILNDSKVVNDLEKQIINKTMYISYNQASLYKINRAQFKYVYYKNHLVKIKYVKHENLIKMQGSVYLKEYEY